MNIIKNILRKIQLFIMCGFLYYLIEICYRGYSHISMFLLAGILGVFFIDTPNNIWGYDVDYLLQTSISTFFCMVGEGITGIIVNKYMKLNIWDYSSLPFTFFYEQCNLFYVFAWFLIIGLVGIPFCDAFWYYICKDDEQPYYKICGREIFRMPTRK